MHSSQNFEAFNTLMRSFIMDLSEVFPEDSAIQSSFTSFDELIRINYRKPATMFMESMGQYAESVANRNEAMFVHMNFPGIDFKKLWFSDISNNTKDAIWQYLSQLLLIAMQC